MLEVQTAREWRLKPSEFWAASDDDQAFMMALVIVEGKMATWDAQEQERKVKRG